MAAAVAFAISAASRAAVAAAMAAGAPGVPAAAMAAAWAIFAAVSSAWSTDSVAEFVAWIAGAEASGMPFHAGRFPIRTVRAGGPPVRSGGVGCTTVSVMRAAGP